ncbi:MAG: tyrosine-type recombinase/integrase [Bacteroidota bacterium]|nr:tyrosine-type recombinase/integrase [Bacteroidota bacterium]
MLVQTSYPQLASFLDYLKFEKRYSQYTIISYQTDLEQFFSYLISQFDTPALGSISASFIRSWLAELKNDGISSKSINRKISSLKSFYKFLLKTGVVQQSPLVTVVAPKISKRLPVFVEEKHMDDLLNRIDFEEGWAGRSEKLIITLFYATGMRLSELIQLKEKQVDYGHSHIKVLGKGNKERIVPVSNGLLREIMLYVEEKHSLFGVACDHVFVNQKGKPYYARAVYDIVKKYLGMVTTIQKKSPHILRHSFATHLMNNGAELNAVKELLGHSSLAATQVYTHNTIEKLKEVFKKAHPKA